MADFCRQCSIKNFGEDYFDLANLGDGPLESDEYGYSVVCEGCGFVRVDKAGQCLGDDDCLRRHEKPEKIYLTDKDVEELKGSAA